MYCFVFGTPHGFCSTEADSDEYQLLESFYNRSDEGETTYIHKRFDDKVFYTRTWRADNQTTFTSKIGRPGAFLGISIEFEKNYYKDLKKIDQFFNDLYSDLVKEGLLSDNGKNKQFKIMKFTDHEDKINDLIKKSIQSSQLDSADLAPFKFNGLKGQAFYNPKDAKNPNIFAKLMEIPYNLVISKKCPTLEMVKARQDSHAKA